MSYSTNDPYTYNDSLILINKLNIKNADLLAQAESTIYDARMSKTPPTGEFDYEHLKALHRHLFGEVYDWAGEARVVNIAKKTNYADTTMFAMFDRIEPEITKILTRLNATPIDSHNLDTFAHQISEYFNEINAVHAFREGNGRTNRLFCSELARINGHYIDWDAMNRKAYIDASIQGSLNVDYRPMAILIRDNTRNYLMRNKRLYVDFQSYANRYIAYEQNKTKEKEVALNQLALKIKTDHAKDIAAIHDKARKLMNNQLPSHLEAAKNIALASDHDIYSLTLVLYSRGHYYARKIRREKNKANEIDHSEGIDI